MSLTLSLIFLIYHIFLFWTIYGYYTFFIQRPLDDSSIVSTDDLVTKTSPYHLSFVSAFLANTFGISWILQQIRDHLLRRHSQLGEGDMAPATPGPSRQPLLSAGTSNSRASISTSPYFTTRQSTDDEPSRSRHKSQAPSQRGSLTQSRSCTPAYSRASTPSGRRSRAASTVGGGEAAEIICAVSEARGIAPTVGLAFINVSTGEAVLSQICDNQSYVKTTHKLTVFEPSRVLIVSTACPPSPKSCLYSTIEEELPGVPTVPLNRRYWSETAGLEFIQALAFSEDVQAIKVAIEGNFYAICSFSAVMKYLELEFSLRIAQHSLRIKYQPSEESMMISLPTIRALELVQNLQNPSSKASLFGLLNNTMTRMGARKLRSNILQPSTQSELVLHPRYNALDELCTKEDMFFEVRKALKGFGDVEKLLTKLIVLPTEPSIEASEQAINDVLMIKNFVTSVPAVFESLAAARCDLLEKIRNYCRPEITTTVLERIAAVINNDVAWVNKPLDLRNQRVYAVRSGIHGLLDVARITYKEATDDMHQHIEELNTELGLAAELKFENRRKYWLRFRVSDFQNGLIPGALINCVRKREFLECQTLQMVKLNQRMTDSVDEVIMQSDKVVQQLLDAIRMEIPNLFKVCESIALLDMLASFGQTVTTRDYVKPELRNALALKSARHPILDSLLEKYIPNDYYASEQYAVHIVTGCNMSGKSTYIRTVALLQVMAQIGCFVPAEYASFKIIHNLFSRTSTDDSIEANMSTFSVEMREMAFILRNVSDKSLAIIDELGRGTSTRDGLSIAIAMAEALVQSEALVFFATHFSELASVLEDRPGVLNLHLATETTLAEDDVPKMTMLYKIGSGIVQEENYGINLAKAIGFPWRFLSVAEDVTNALRQASEANKKNSESRKVAKRRKLVLSLREALVQANDSDMDDETLRRLLQRLQFEFTHRMELIDGGGSGTNADPGRISDESDVQSRTDVEEQDDESMSTSSPGTLPEDGASMLERDGSSSTTTGDRN